ncbi:hypothetical protein EDB80DRAFT_245213 [Ilyonectria destructans]|nr:hypothetical protein EDB80DRAFT_245213 [Ilyonectria destructans]
MQKSVATGRLGAGRYLQNFKKLVSLTGRRGVRTFCTARQRVTACSLPALLVPSGTKHRESRSRFEHPFPLIPTLPPRPPRVTPATHIPALAVAPVACRPPLPCLHILHIHHLHICPSTHPRRDLAPKPFPVDSVLWCLVSDISSLAPPLPPFLLHQYTALGFIIKPKLNWAKCQSSMLDINYFLLPCALLFHCPGRFIAGN